MLLLAHGAARGVVVDHMRAVILVNERLYVAGTISFRFDTVFAGLEVAGQPCHRNRGRIRTYRLLLSTLDAPFPASWPSQ